MKKVSREIIDEIVKRLVDEIQPEQTILFGSYAWGVPNENSDLDLMVIVTNSDTSATKRAMRAYRCLRGLNVPKNMIIKTRDEIERFRKVHASLECEVLERGKILYE